MKKTFFPAGLLFAFCFSVFGQVDSAAVVREVDSLIQVSLSHTGKRDFDKALEVNAFAEKLALGKLGRESAAYSNTCNNHGVVLYLRGDKPETEKWWQETKDIREKVFGTKHPMYAKILHNLAILYVDMGSFEKAEPLYLESKAIREKVLGKENLDYAWSLNNLANLYWKIGKYEKAEPLYLESKAIREKVLGKEHPDYAASLNNLAVLYWSMGNYEKSEPVHLESIGIREKALGKEHPDYAASLNNLASLYYEMGNYEQSELLHLEAKTIYEKALGKEHPDYAASLTNLAIIYQNMGSYEKVEPLFLETKAIREKVLGKEHPDYAASVSNLASLYYQMGNYMKFEPLCLESKAIWEKALGKEHPEYAISIDGLALLYKAMGNYDKAEPLFLESKTIREKALGKEHPIYATSLNNLAILFVNMGKYEKAEPLYLEGMTIQEKVLGKEHPDYAASLNYLAILNWTIGDLDAAQSLLLKSGGIEKSLLLKATRYLSERELSSYTRKFTDVLNQSYSFTLFRPDISSTSYDNTLFYKGFLLNAASHARNLALSNPPATDDYIRLKSFHRRLASEYSKPIAERKNVAELEEKANTLEKELTRSVAGFGEALRQVNWQEVQAALKSGEAAIEFIRFHYRNPNPTDSTLYAALLLKPGMASPAFIGLFEEKQLDALLAPLAAQGSSGLNELYGGLTGQSLYRLLWSPLEPHLAGVKTVYYSPAGLLHRLNLNAIPSGKLDETIGKRHALSMLGSTRSLAGGTKARQLITSLAFAEAMAGKPATATVFGGIRYDMDSTAIKADNPSGLASRNRGLSFSQTDSMSRGGTWEYLKHSDKEAGNIQSLLQKAGFQADVQKGYAATEEAFKQLGKDKPSPRLLHISTHGFFFPDPQDNPKSAIPNPQSEAPVFKISDHPMIRSGLILAGGNHAWKTGQPLGNREDGILTAYEISQLDLRNTDLVVLSACETGLGQIEGNEGVYGLQRAFKIAGAKHLVMSLWQVPDYQTQELMTAFYRNMLEGKMPVRQALHAAQEEMRQKRYEPYYWAGFVLVE
ncbi:MAG: hypothetical protein EPGJADBJ_00890 [Saprospiraceae bacterium]|nr:hypothetical protein [Saprospiraceae bacterium]